MLPERQGERDLAKEDLEQVLRQVYGEIPARIQVRDGEIQYHFATWKQHLTFAAIMAGLAASVLFGLGIDVRSALVTAFATICQITVFSLTVAWYASIFNKVLVLTRDSIGVRSGTRLTSARWADISEISYSELMFDSFTVKSADGQGEFRFPRLWTENDYSDTEGSQQFALLVKTLNPASPSVMKGPGWTARIAGNRRLAVKLIAPAVILVIAALWLFFLAPKQEIFQFLQMLIVIPIGLTVILIVMGFNKSARTPQEALPLPSQSYSLLWYLKNPEWDSNSRLYRFKKSANSFTSASKRKRDLWFELLEAFLLITASTGAIWFRHWTAMILGFAAVVLPIRKVIAFWVEMKTKQMENADLRHSLEFTNEGEYLVQKGKRVFVNEMNLVPKNNLLEVKTVEGTFHLDPAIMFDEADTEAGSKPLQ